MLERKRDRKTNERGTERKREVGGREGGLKDKLRSGCTHRGGWAIGPGSTPPSFVLTPAALPPK